MYVSDIMTQPCENSSDAQIPVRSDFSLCDSPVHDVDVGDGIYTSRSSYTGDDVSNDVYFNSDFKSI